MRNSLLEVTPVIPETLARLPELAGNLFFSWHRPIRALFEDLDPELWKQTNGNPRLMIRCVDQFALERAASDGGYLERYREALEVLDAYVRVSAPGADEPLIAYFCAEYGFHESFPIYSGGLGVLAADYCKAASDSAPTSSPWDCSTSRAISPRRSTTTAISRPSTASAIRAICRSSWCAPRQASGSR